MSAPSLVKRNPFCFCLLHHAYSAMAVHSLFILCLYWKASHILSSLSHNKTLVHPSISSHLRLFQIMLFLHHRFCPHTRFTTTLCHSVPKCEDMPWHDIIKSGPAVHLRILFALCPPLMDGFHLAQMWGYLFTSTAEELYSSRPDAEAMRPAWTQSAFTYLTVGAGGSSIGACVCVWWIDWESDHIVLHAAVNAELLSCELVHSGHCLCR